MVNKTQRLLGLATCVLVVLSSGFNRRPRSMRAHNHASAVDSPPPRQRRFRCADLPPLPRDGRYSSCTEHVRDCPPEVPVPKSQLMLQVFHHSGCKVRKNLRGGFTPHHLSPYRRSEQVGNVFVLFAFCQSLSLMRSGGQGAMPRLSLGVPGDDTVLAGVLCIFESPRSCAILVRKTR